MKWEEVLKVTGTVTTTSHAPLFNRRYSIEEEEEENIEKATKKTEKRAGDEGDHYIEQEMPDKGDLSKRYEKWKKDCQGIDASSMAIKGSAGDLNLNIQNLLQLVNNHIKGEIRRPKYRGQNTTGLKNVTEFLDRVVGDRTELIHDKDADRIKKTLLPMLKKMASPNSSKNPANIPFTVPVGFTTIEGKKVPDYPDEPNVFGHYRTPLYVKARKLKAKEDDSVKDHTVGAAKSSWYSDKQDASARPPFWQAMFSGAEAVHKEKGDGTISEGLLMILEDFVDGTDEMWIPIIHVNQTQELQPRNIQVKRDITPIVGIDDVGVQINRLLRNTRSYRGNTSKLIYGGANGVLTQFSQIEFKVKADESKNIAQYAGIKGLAGDDDIRSFTLGVSAALFDNLVNELVDRNTFKTPTNNKVLSLQTDTRTKLRRYDWFRQQEAAEKKKKEAQKKKQKEARKKKVKKSWSELLWA